MVANREKRTTDRNKFKYVGVFEDIFVNNLIPGSLICFLCFSDLQLAAEVELR